MYVCTHIHTSIQTYKFVFAIIASMYTGKEREACEEQLGTPSII